MLQKRTSQKTFINSYHLCHNQTEAEARLWQVLRMHQLNDIHFRRQHAIGPYIVDFVAPRQKIIIELDGAASTWNNKNMTLSAQLIWKQRDIGC